MAEQSCASDGACRGGGIYDVFVKYNKNLHIPEKSTIFAGEITANTKTMPEISSFYGISVYMYMSEHNPPHFHVKYQDYEAIITIKDGIITGSFPRRALHLVYDWLDQHQEELMQNWERLGKSESPVKINPLQ